MRVCNAGAAVTQPEAPQPRRQVTREGSSAALADDWTVGSMHTERMTPQMLLSSEPLATGLTRIGPLPRVQADMPLKDALLFGTVGAERTLVQLDGHHQHITFQLVPSSRAAAKLRAKKIHT